MSPTSVSPVPSKSRSRARMHGDQRRQQFIDAALRLFSSNGFRGTSTKAIADAAGASEALLFRHFATKAELYQAILQRKADASGFSQRFSEFRQLAQGDDDHAVVEALVRSVLDSYRRDTVFERLMLYAGLEGHELATASRQLFGKPAFTVLRDYVVRRQQAGVFRPGDPVVLVFALMALPAYFSLIYRVLSPPSRAHADRADATLFTELVLNGVRVRPDETHARAGRRATRPPARPASSSRRGR